MNIYKWMTFIHLILLRTSLGIEKHSSILKIVLKLGPHFKISFFGCDNMDPNSFSKMLSNYTYLNTCTNKFDKYFSVRTWHRQLFIIDLSCENIPIIIKKANNENLYAYPFTWLVVYENKSLQHLMKDIFYNLNILVDSNFYLVALHENRTVSLCKIFKSHKLSKSYRIENLTTKLLDDQENIMNPLRTNIGVVLNVSSVLRVNDSFNHLTDKRDGHVDPTSKINFSLLPLMASKFNISLNFMFSDKWGTEINKTYGFSGLMRDIITTKTAELSGAPLFMFKKRVPVIDYVAVTTPTIIKFVFRQPKLSYISNLYILPFANEVWLALFGLTILLIFTTFAVNKWERKLDKLSTAEDTDFLTKEGAIFTDAAFLTMSAFCQQGFNNLPKRTPGKLATLIVYLSLMFIFVSYSAKILALLQSSSNSITSLEDLLNSRMLLGALETDYHRIFFSTVKEPLRKAIVEKKIAPPGQRPNYLDLEEGIKRVKAGQFAFHVQLGAAYYVISKTFIEQEKCGLHTIDFFNLGNPYMAIQKNSSYKELLKIGFRLVQEIGIQKRENNLIYTKKPICSNAGGEFIDVTIIDIYPIIVFLLGGWLLSIFIFILEMYYYYKTHFPKENSNYFQFVSNKSHN